MPKKKQVSIEVIEYIQRTINELLESKMEQNCKRKLCIAMEKLLKDIKQKDNDYQYLYWNKYGKLDWSAERESHLTKLTVGDTIKIPKEYITGPDYNGADDFVSDIQGEWSRVYY
jgi:macrodomain Ter protein organizer (MatP/YcbG family)